MDAIFEAYLAAQRRRRSLAIDAQGDSARAAGRRSGGSTRTRSPPAELTLLQCEEYFDELLERQAPSRPSAATSPSAGRLPLRRPPRPGRARPDRRRAAAVAARHRAGDLQQRRAAGDPRGDPLRAGGARLLPLRLRRAPARRGGGASLGAGRLRALADAADRQGRQVPARPLAPRLERGPARAARHARGRASSTCSSTINGQPACCRDARPVRPGAGRPRRRRGRLSPRMRSAARSRR